MCYNCYPHYCYYYYFKYSVAQLAKEESSTIPLTGSHLLFQAEGQFQRREKSEVDRKFQGNGPR